MNFFDEYIIKIGREIIRNEGFWILISAIVTAWISFKMYKRQRELEKIDKRYLKSFDKLIFDLEKLRLILEKNYIESFAVLDYYQRYKNFGLKKFEDRYNNFKAEEINLSIPESVLIVDSLCQDKEFGKYLITMILKIQYLIRAININIFIKNILDSYDKFNAEKHQKEYIQKQFDDFAKEYNLYEKISILRCIAAIVGSLNIDSNKKLEKIQKIRKIKKYLKWFIEGADRRKIKEKILDFFKKLIIKI